MFTLLTLLISNFIIATYITFIRSSCFYSIMAVMSGLKVPMAKWCPFSVHSVHHLTLDIWGIFSAPSGYFQCTEISQTY